MWATSTQSDQSLSCALKWYLRVQAQADLKFGWVHMPLCGFYHGAAQISKEMVTSHKWAYAKH